MMSTGIARIEKKKRELLVLADGEPELTTETDGTDFGLYSYDGFNRVKTYTNGVKQINYGYNAENLRTYKTVNGEFTGYVWNGSSLAAETSGNAVTSTYTYGADGITTANINGTTNIYLKNVHGDIVGMTDTNGTLQKSYRYDAFGNEQTPDEADKNPFRYTGEYFDKETDNIYLRNRYYSPNIGRFITEDTYWNTSNMIYGDREYKDGEMKIPDIHAIIQSSNLYVYCINNSVNFEDVNGFSAIAVSGSPTSIWQDYNDLPYSLKSSINCYAYAMGMVTNPITGKKFNSFFPPVGFQPGMLVGKNQSYYYSGEQIVNLMREDAHAAGMYFGILNDPNHVIPAGTWKIALARSTTTGDYHFYRQNADGTWSHKPGAEDVRITDNKGNVIYNPAEAHRGDYDEFIGFYFVGYLQ